MNSFESLVSLNFIPQVGSARLAVLLERFREPENIFKASRQELAAVCGERTAREIADFNPRLLEDDLAFAKKAGVSIITLFDRDYPRLLREIPGAPLVLYVSGDITAADYPAIAIVGSRRASFYGLSSAEKFAGELSAKGITIVSGMARGVDTCAHKGALRVKGRTIAVMGSGFNHIYPPENAGLAERISENGAVISEFPMRTKPLARNFPRRNRLISGLSLGILVAEAARNSGALITADFALEQGRDVFALPGRIDSRGSYGANSLLKQGAKLVTCCEDILEELNLPFAAAGGPESGAAQVKPFSSKEEELLYACISRRAVTMDDLVEKTSGSCGHLAELILRLQFKKLIRELPGKQFIRS